MADYRPADQGFNFSETITLGHLFLILRLSPDATGLLLSITFTEYTILTIFL